MEWTLANRVNPRNVSSWKLQSRPLLFLRTTLMASPGLAVLLSQDFDLDLIPSVLETGRSKVSVKQSVSQANCQLSKVSVKQSVSQAKFQSSKVSVKQSFSQAKFQSSKVSVKQSVSQAKCQSNTPTSYFCWKVNKITHISRQCNSYVCTAGVPEVSAVVLYATSELI